MAKLDKYRVVKESTTVIGRTIKQRFDTVKYNWALDLFEQGRDEEARAMLDAARKPLFQDNFIWRILFKLTKKDIQIPYITGVFTFAPLAHNLVTTRGKRIIAEQLVGVTTAPVTAIALGTGAVAPAAGDTALGSEISTSGGSRGAATASNQTTSTTGDTARLTKTFTITGTLAVTEEGLFDNNSSGGNMLARQTFSAQNLVNGDTFIVTHDVQFT